MVPDDGGCRCGGSRLGAASGDASPGHVDITGEPARGEAGPSRPRSWMGPRPARLLRADERPDRVAVGYVYDRQLRLRRPHSHRGRKRNDMDRLTATAALRAAMDGLPDQDLLRVLRLTCGDSLLLGIGHRPSVQRV